MREDYVECSELSGKTIQTLRIHRDIGDGIDVEIPLAAGTSFSCFLLNKSAVKASLYEVGLAPLKRSRSYEI